MCVGSTGSLGSGWLVDHGAWVAAGGDFEPRPLGQRPLPEGAVVGGADGQGFGKWALLVDIEAGDAAGGEPVPQAALRAGCEAFLADLVTTAPSAMKA